ncbi:Cytochrome c556 [Colwellia chukchiensis]|uniref:Cytochrome c556 n=1 Tax=Colwellia chukchiensis TaxID=641665 RepID=A0A1H7G9G9_9GAMM|nr:cytochrome c [Colwellia chukchiensis]SEK34789.1 Cytochrome c556 [Colwellia chukchiensis]
MNYLTKAILTSAAILTATSVMADSAKSLDHAEKATKNRQAVFTLLGSNMGPLGAMAKGRIALDAKVVEKNATRINQLSLMIADYTKTDTSGFNVKSDALAKIWQEPKAFTKRINALSKASAHLQMTAKTADESAIKKAIAGVGKTCGGCHDDYKAD